MKIKQNLFDLTEEQESMSKMMYNGKIVKCLVVPFHTYEQLEQEIDYTPTTFLIPERSMSPDQVRGFISMVANSPKEGEFRIITANVNIICDMIDSSVRILTEGGDIVDCPCKTFMANIHTIRYDIFENQSFRLTDRERNSGETKVNSLIDAIKSKSSITKTEFDNLMVHIDMIGEDLIRVKLKEMAYDKLE